MNAIIHDGNEMGFCFNNQSKDNRKARTKS